MQLLNLTQQIKDYLSDKPELLRKYVNFGTTGVYYAIQPINAVMRHLILVQGLDPNAIPGEKEHREFSDALQHVFDGMHNKSLDADYDFSWVAKKFAQVRDELPEFDLTREEFNGYTDIRKLQDTRETDVKVMESPFGTDTSRTVETNPVDDLAAYFAVPHELTEESIKEGIEKLDKIISHYELERLKEEPTPDTKELFARTDRLRDVKKTVEQYGSVSGKLGQRADCKPRKIAKAPTTKVVKKSKRGSFKRSPRQS